MKLIIFIKYYLLTKGNMSPYLPLGCNAGILVLPLYTNKLNNIQYYIKVLIIKSSLHSE